MVAIKQTLYRIGKDSPLHPGADEARDDDTQVAVLVELKARFDEENNITWAEELERHGVHVAYGLAGLKTHCKATLVVRREPTACAATSTWRPATTTRRRPASTRTSAILTAREDIGADVSELFNVLTGFRTAGRYRQDLGRAGLAAPAAACRIEREIEAHAAQGNGHLVFKMNSLVDRAVIRALYAASQAGVKIDLIVRGACCLRPGVPGWSETIRVYQPRRPLPRAQPDLLLWQRWRRDEVYLGSADLMERNLDRRVEVVFPVEDRGWAAEIRDEILGAYLRDTVNAWELDATARTGGIEPAPGEAPFDVQAWLVAAVPAVSDAPGGTLRRQSVTQAVAGGTMSSTDQHRLMNGATA